MDPKIKYMILKMVQNNNILPVTSVCNMACQFCSHRNNPSGLDVYSLGHLDLSVIEELLNYLPPEGPVIIGESATRMIEGDPITHPNFKKIINKIRYKYPVKQIKITTNGSNLNHEMIEFLQTNNPVELNISLNCSDPNERVFLMADKNPKNVFAGMELLTKSTIKFNGSIVAMPHLTGWQELERSIKTLLKYNPETIRIFMPGFTRFSEDKLKFDIELMYNKLSNLIEKFTKIDIPVLLEPPMIDNFKCIVKGVIKGTPAFKAGMIQGDIIKTVNNKKVMTRVDGFNKILFSPDPVVELKRSRGSKNITLKKKKSESSGIIVDYDMDLNTLKKLSGVLLAKGSNQATTIVTSTLGQGILKAFLNYFHNKYTYIFEDREIDLIVAKNDFFAGSIMSAGLLTNQDIINSIKKTGKNYKLIIVPGIIFDIFGNDLTGKNYKQIEEELGNEIVII